MTRAFGDRIAVDGVSFRLEPGRVCALLGPNGAGKTTTVRLLMGLIPPTGGGATVAGVTVPGPAAELARLRATVGLLTETPGFYDRLSALENLTLFGRLYRIDPPRLAERIEEHLTRLGLWDRRDDPVATFSKGMKQRLAIIRSVFHEPAVIFFDEPTAGLDPESARDVRRLITSLKRAGRTIVVCTHNLAEAAELADVIAILRHRLIAFGPPDALGRPADGAARHRITIAGGAAGATAVVAALPGVAVTALDDARLELSVADPDTAIPAAVGALVRAGYEIREVRPVERTLEEIYLAAIGGAA